ncbi:MAG TPA: cytochrome c [Candidatus Limnocylindrales bacterium]|nr:cytochrome c [Candidatus Limnocylindrales bacterium]
MKPGMRPGISALLFASLCFLCSAQTKPESTEPPTDYSELDKAPAKYRAKANPMVKDKNAVAAGGVLFEEHCAECHGETALGTKKAPSLRVPQVQTAPPGSLFWILTNGIVRKGMPVWSKLPEPQRWQLISFIQSLGPAEAAENKAAGKP